MKLALFVFVLLAFVVMSSLYIAEEDNTLEVELKSIKHRDTSPLIKLREKFSKIDINSEKLDLSQAIKEIKEARKLYPLDDKLKMIDMELEHKRANESYKSTKNTTPNN